MSEGLSFTPAEGRALRYCTYCPRLCRFACPVAHGESRETVTPWGLMRLLNLVSQDVVEADESVLETLSHCVSCGRCQSFCMHDNPVAEILADGRAQLIGRGLRVPDSFSVPVGGCDPALELPDGAPSAAEFEAVFLPSCAHLADDESRERLGRVLEHLPKAGLSIGLPSSKKMVGCGFHEWEVGLAEAAAGSWKRFVGQAEGGLRVVTDCASSLWLARDADGGDNGVGHLIEWVAAHLDDFPDGTSSAVVAIHDSCFVSRRLRLGDALRAVVGHIYGSEPQDLHQARDEARCCGAEGRWAQAEPEAQIEAARTVIDDIADSGADIVVTGSPKCRASLASQAAERGLTIQILDLLDVLLEIPAVS